MLLQTSAFIHCHRWTGLVDHLDSALAGVAVDYSSIDSRFVFDPVSVGGNIQVLARRVHDRSRGSAQDIDTQKIIGAERFEHPSDIQALAVNLFRNRLTA